MYKTGEFTPSVQDDKTYVTVTRKLSSDRNIVLDYISRQYLA